MTQLSGEEPAAFLMPEFGIQHGQCEKLRDKEMTHWRGTRCLSRAAVWPSHGQHDHSVASPLPAACPSNSYIALFLSSSYPGATVMNKICCKAQVKLD